MMLRRCLESPPPLVPRSVDSQVRILCIISLNLTLGAHMVLPEEPQRARLRLIAQTLRR